MFKSLLIFTVFMSLSFSQDLNDLFQKYDVDGSLVISSLKGKTNIVYNASRANTPVLPASTFKILNTLIGLDEKVISKDEIFVWDQKDRGWSAWNKNQTLKSAFQFSCVWCYQKVANKLSHEVYLNHLNKIDYGNHKTGKELDRFWLDGDLKISSFGQIDFLKKVYMNNLPYKKEHVQTLKDIMFLKSYDNYSVSGKTGWINQKDKHYGWFVGYLQTKYDVYFFATNLDIRSKKQLRLRQIITMEAFKIKGII